VARRGEGIASNLFAPNPENKKDALGRLSYAILGNISLKVQTNRIHSLPIDLFYLRY
jgi:hypothetical protein